MADDVTFILRYSKISFFIMNYIGVVTIEFDIERLSKKVEELQKSSSVQFSAFLLLPHSSAGLAKKSVHQPILFSA